MPIQQITVFLENKIGGLADVTRVLEKENINLQGFSATEAGDYSVIRLVISEVDKAKEALEKAGFLTHMTKAICVRIEDRPGELLKVLDTLSASNIDIDYTYIIAGTRVVMNLSELEKAENLLKKKGFLICNE